MSDRQQIEVQPDLVGQSLAPQLGSDAKEINSGSITLPRLSIIKSELVLPLSYCGLRAEMGSTTFRFLRNDLLNLYIGVNGRGRAELIKMEVASRGGSVTPEYQDPKPGWVERHITQRNWAEKRLEEQSR